MANQNPSDDELLALAGTLAFAAEELLRGPMTATKVINLDNSLNRYNKAIMGAQKTHRNSTQSRSEAQQATEDLAKIGTTLPLRDR
jgi:hypothetical protein